MKQVQVEEGVVLADLHPLHSGGGLPVWWRFAVVFIVFTGIVCPVLTTFVGGALFPAQAGGSLVVVHGVVRGSRLIGQMFSSDRYFIGRPSIAGAGYDPLAASGSNLASSNPILRERAVRQSREIVARERIQPLEIPGELIAAGGSGLDPHISPEAAELQISRVAQTRGLERAQVRKLVHAYTEDKTFGVLGQQRVNVLLLNLALDAFEGN